MVSGISVDKFLRKPIILISSVIATASSTIACSYVTNTWQLIVFRGAGTYGGYMCTMLYQSEFSPPSFRPIFTTILLMAFSLSFFLIDLLAFYVNNWRDISRYAALPPPPPPPPIIIVCFLPEPPKWLLANGGNEPANHGENCNMNFIATIIDSSQIYF